MLPRVEVVHDPAEEVEQGGSDGRVRLHGVVHHQNGRLDVHDVVLVRVEEQPVVEESKLGVACGNLARKRRQKNKHYSNGVNGNNREMRRCQMTQRFTVLNKHEIRGVEF